MVSRDNHPVIKVGVPLGIEVVPNVPMQFLAKVRDLPSPLRLNIKYMDRMSQKKKDLQITVGFGTCKHEHGEDEGSHRNQPKAHGGRKFVGPNFLMIESRGGG